MRRAQWQFHMPARFRQQLGAAQVHAQLVQRQGASRTPGGGCRSGRQGRQRVQVARQLAGAMRTLN